MFIDASAIIAILNSEQEAKALIGRLESGIGENLYSPLSRFEAIVSLARSRAGKQKAATPEQLDRAKAAVDLLLREVAAQDMAISDSIGAAALDAARRYGRVVGHNADLNFGDCFAYACAKEQGVALLYKGGDFVQTDLA